MHSKWINNNNANNGSLSVPSIKTEITDVEEEEED
jgi:hypothetical protein